MSKSNIAIHSTPDDAREAYFHAWGVRPPATMPLGTVVQEVLNAHLPPDKRISLTNTGRMSPQQWRDMVAHFRALGNVTPQAVKAYTDSIGLHYSQRMWYVYASQLQEELNHGK